MLEKDKGESCSEIREPFETDHKQKASGDLPKDGLSDGADKKPHKKRWLVLIIIAVVLVSGACGFMAWHQQPSFCNAVCHTPMDNYVEGYSSKSSVLLAAKHADNGVKCLDCHESVLGEQITEGITWINGDYEVDEEGFIVNAPTANLGTRDFCFKCHNDGNVADGEDWDDIVATTANWGGEEDVNPHDSHNGAEECYTCHSSHKTSTFACNKCHGWAVPEGWDVPALF